MHNGVPGGNATQKLYKNKWMQERYMQSNSLFF